MKDRAIRREVWLALLYLGLGVASALLWVRIMTYEPLLPGQPPRLFTWHEEMISGNASAPNQYRILTPWLADLILPLMPNESLIGAYFVIRALCIGLSLFLFDRYMRTWFSLGAAAAGALCLSAVIPFGYYLVVQESDPLNLLVFVAAFLALTRRKDMWLAPLVLVGTLNRETPAMLPAAYLLARWGEEPPRRAVGRTALLAACWVVAYGWLLGHYQLKSSYTDWVMLRANLGTWRPTVFAFLTFGVVWLLPVLALKHDPPKLLRRCVWLVPPFVALHYVIAVVQEVRLFLPLAPIVLPLSWWVLFPEARRVAPTVSGRTPKR